MNPTPEESLRLGRSFEKPLFFVAHNDVRIWTKGQKNSDKPGRSLR